MVERGYPRAILFDLDDTLISFDRASDIAWERLCGRYVAECAPEFAPEDLLAAITRQRRWFWGDPERHRTGRMDMHGARRTIIIGALRTLEVADTSCADRLASLFTVEQEAGIDLFPDTLPTLEKLTARGVRMAILTNGTVAVQQAKIDRFGLARFFECILIEEAVGAGKPDRRMYDVALEKLRIPASDVWMVGDNLVWDVAGAQRVGIRSVWFDVKGGGLPRDSEIRPDRIIRSATELLEEPQT